MSTETKTIEQLLAELDALGSADAIAAYLIEHGHTGPRFSALRCPVASYVRASTGAWFDICEVLWADDEGMGSVPRNVATFIVRHDKGRYPALVAPKAAR